ncbi:Phosphate transporter family [Candidatus Magnetomoraceae bacterium gMMP-1]
MWKVLSGIFLGWSLGANDSANIFGTGVTTGVIKYQTAVILTAVFLMFGAFLEGSKCMKTISELSTLIPMEAFCCTLAAAITMTILTMLAIPASASQAVIGTVFGAGILSQTADFSKLYKIILCWVATPVSGIILGYVIYRVLQFILNKIVKSLTLRNRLYFIGILLAGSYGAYSLGANNVANVTGVYVDAGILTSKMAVIIGGLSIALGVLTYSKKVMMTVGKGIVPLDPFSAFVVVLSEALTLHIFTQIGVPVSSSQAVVGAVIGVGVVGNVQTVRLKMLIKIAIGWILTPVVAGMLTFLFIIWTVVL